MIELADALALFGNFKMQVWDHSKGGSPRLRLNWVRKNQITNQGRVALLTLMRPFGVANGQEINKIWSLAVGTNATPASINDDDTTMTEVWASAFVFASGECDLVATAPDSYYLSISKTLGLGDANGSTLTEAGVFTRGDNDDPSLASGRKLYARQVHTPIPKVATMTITYGWQLGITIQS